MKQLPEYKVTLTRLNEGEAAYPQGDDIPHYEHQGQRTKLGGLPDCHVDSDWWPACPECGDTMNFIAQIDSIEHDWSSNPNAQPAGSPEQQWKFGDVFMIYVFFCFDCCESKSLVVK